MVGLLRDRGFRLLWLGGLVSIAGDWLLRAALPFFVYEQTESTVATAGMVVATLLPGALLGSIAGVFVDRWDRRRVLVAAGLVQSAVVLTLLVVAAGHTLWIVYLVATLQSVVSAFSAPAETTLVSEIVEPDQRLAANALNALNNRVGRLIGAPAGGVIYAATGLGTVIVVDCLSFLAASLLVLGVPSRALRRASARQARAAGSMRRELWHEWTDGTRYVVSDRSVGLLFVVLALGTFAGTMLDPLTVAWVRDVLQEGPGVFAALIAIHAALGITATLVVSRLDARMSPRALIGGTTAVAAVATGLKYGLPSLPLAAAMTAIQGFTSVASAVGVETLAMNVVRADVRGRVFGSLNATLMLSSLLGAATAGVLGDLVGLTPMLSLSAALIGVSAIVVFGGFRDPPEPRSIAGRNRCEPPSR